MLLAETLFLIQGLSNIQAIPYCLVSQVKVCDYVRLYQAHDALWSSSICKVENRIRGKNSACGHYILVYSTIIGSMNEKM